MTDKFNHYNKENKSFARQLRKNSTLTEIILWTKLLKVRQLKGYQFFRQKPIDKYIVDFFCKDLKLIVELDGESHILNEKHDKKRQARLENLGYCFVRFKEGEVFHDFEKVKTTLENWIENYEKANPDIIKFSKRKKNNSSPWPPL